ncbi:MAG: tyrosine-type recombinase/integrase [Actinomycetes bacterium]
MGRRHFGALRRLASGRWQARYRGLDGQMRPAPVTFVTKSEAARWLSLVETQLTSGTWQDSRRGEIPIGEFADAWVDERPNLRPKTVELYRSLLRRHVRPYLGDVWVNRLSTERVRVWRRALLDAGVSPTTTAKAYRLLRSIMTTAVDDELIHRNPCRLRGASTEPTPERPVATVAQVMEIANRVPVRFRAMVLLGTFASLRWGELVALRRRNLDLDRGIVRVVAAYNELSTGGMHLGQPKSAAGRRIVAIPQSIVPDLAWHVAEFAAAGPDGFVFVGPQGGPLRRSNFNKDVPWHAITKAVGLPGLRFHDLRHTGNTLAAPYASTRELMSRMGHSSTRAAIIYQHATEDRDRVIADALDTLLAAGMVTPEEAERAADDP